MVIKLKSKIFLASFFVTSKWIGKSFAAPGSTYDSTVGRTEFSLAEDLFTAEGYNPCILAAGLLANCAPEGEGYTIYPINSTGFSYEQIYPGPTREEGESAMGECFCTGAVYNALSACSYAQISSTPDNFGNYLQNCTRWVASPGYPSHLEEQLAELSPPLSLPNWALIDTRLSGYQFSDANIVGLDGDPSEAAGEEFGTYTRYIYPTRVPDFGSSSGSGSSGGGYDEINYGAILGGTFGGLAGFYLLLGLLAIYLVKKRKARAKERLAGKIA